MSRVCNFILVATLYFLLSLTLGRAAWAQLLPNLQTKSAQEAPPAAASSAAPAIEPVPLNDIAKRLEASRRLLKELSEKPEASELTDVTKEVDGTRDEFADDVKNVEKAIAGFPRPEELWDLEVSWKNRGVKIAKWQALVSQWSTRLYKDLTVVDQEEKTWELTLKSYPARTLPRELERTIRDVLDEAKKVKSRVQRRVDATLILENQLYQRETSISTILGNISLAKDRFRDSLVVAERAPLWQAMNEWQGIKLPAGGIEAMFFRQIADSLTFIADRSRQFIIVVFGFIAALILAFVLSRKMARWTQDHPHFEAATHFLMRPVSLASLITLVPLILFMAGTAPRLIMAVGGLLLLVPLLRLLPPLIHPAARPALFCLAGFFVYNSVFRLLLVVPLFDRLSFVFFDFLALVVLVWLGRTARVKRSTSEKPTPPYLIICYRVVAIVILIALIANVIGFFDLASVLSNGTLYSLYAGFLLYGAAQAASVLFAVFLDTDWARSVSVIRHYGKDISRWAFRIFEFIGFAFWVSAFLNFFTVRTAVVGAIVSFFTAPIKENRVPFSLWDILAFGLVLAAAILIARGVRVILQEDVFPRVRTGRGVPAMITSAMYYSILLVGFFFALGIAGVDINRFNLLAGAFGVGIGFGLQNIVNNFVSGLILLFERPIQPGDNIEVGGLVGRVRHIGIRSSTITMGNGAEAIIPNASLISEKLMNWSFTYSWRRIDIDVRVAQGSDIQKVTQILLSVAAADRGVRRDPAPAVLLQSFAENSLNFELRLWVDLYTDAETKSRVSIALVQALRAAGIETPLPQRDLRLTVKDERMEELLTPSEPGLRKTK